MVQIGQNNPFDLINKFKQQQPQTGFGSQQQLQRPSFQAGGGSQAQPQAVQGVNNPRFNGEASMVNFMANIDKFNLNKPAPPFGTNKAWSA